MTTPENAISRHATSDGTIADLAWRVADIRAAEQALMATLAPGTLMARAAAGLARRCVELVSGRFGAVYGRSVLLLVGAGDNGGDALDVLRQDHQAVRKLFLQYARFKPGALSGDGKIDVIQNLCRALAVHAQIEEELFYPALSEAGEKDRVPVETGAEHATIRRLAEELRNAKPGDELADAKMKVLADYVQQHVDEEESELFSEARAAGFDLRALGEQLNARKAELGAIEADLGDQRDGRSPSPRSEPAAAQA